MEQAHKRSFLPVILSLAALALFSLLLAGLYRFDNKYTAGPPYGGAGVFSFSEADLARPLFLIDGWLLNGQEVFIGQYSNFSYLPGGASPFGAAGYRLTLRYSGAPTTLLLQLPEIFTNYTLWINGEKAAVRGGGRLVAVPVGGDTALFLETENHTHYYSGLTYPPALGTAAVMDRLLFVRTLFYSFLCVGSLTLAVFSLVLWAARGQAPLFCQFGVLCLAFAVSCAHPFVWQLGGSSPLWYALEDGARLLVCAQAAALAAAAAGLSGSPWYRRCLRPALLAGCGLCVLSVVFIIPGGGAFVNVYGALIDGYKMVIWAFLALCAGVGLARGGGWQNFFTLTACGVLGVSLLAGLLDSNRFEPIYTGWQSEYAGLALVLLFGGLMVRRNAQLLRQSAELRALKLQDRFAAESAAQMRASIQQVRSLKHELRHHVETLQALYAAGDSLRLGEYLAGLGRQKDALPPLYYSENFLVNALLAARLGPAQEKGVRIQCTASVPAALSIADADLCTLLANALDNAVEACARLPSGADRFIRLSLTVRGELLILSCANSAPPRAPGAPLLTSKPDAVSHGLGIPAMQRVVRAYGGALDLVQQGGAFTLRAVLHLPPPGPPPTGA
ncbi:sensor histidine kinase [Allofournierella sp.]|uniref:sensor histidine kinase n=1 Tax=Allofournierella sp. TaxID=1940256 RepID=UPI003AB7CE63